jgi:hypothetical protein
MVVKAFAKQISATSGSDNPRLQSCVESDVHDVHDDTELSRRDALKTGIAPRQGPSAFVCKVLFRDAYTHISTCNILSISIDELPPRS